jgi:hypothetical protein
MRDNHKSENRDDSREAFGDPAIIQISINASNEAVALPIIQCDGWVPDAQIS